MNTYSSSTPDIGWVSGITSAVLQRKKERERLKNVKCEKFCFLRLDHQEAMPRLQHLWEVLTVFFSPLVETRSLLLEQVGWNSKYYEEENGNRKSKKTFIELYLSMRKHARSWPSHGKFLTLVIRVFLEVLLPCYT